MDATQKSSCCLLMCCALLRRGAHRNLESLEGEKKTAIKESAKAACALPDVGSQGMVFGLGLALGSVAGALLTYLGALQRH